MQDMEFAKKDFVMAVLGLAVYIVDVGADLWVAVRYIMEEQYLWSTLTLGVGLISSAVVQIFSYTWFIEDSCRMPNQIFLLHFLHGGIFTRYWFAVKYGYQAAFKANNSEDILTDTRILHKRVIDEITDITMLRLFKAFLENTPQLILQIYILMTSDSSTFSQYVSITTSFCGISCTVVDYQIALRKSLPDKNTFRGIASKMMYFFYKLFTLTSWVLSITLMAVLKFKCFIFLLTILWCIGLLWVFRQHTKFCKSKTTEMIYRIVVGIILIFTFFNVKGNKTRTPLTAYYVSRVLITFAIVVAWVACKPLFNETLHLLSVIIVAAITLVLGIIFLIVYYAFFHPSIYYTQDVVDGVQSEREETCRMVHFLML
uniref:XK-related protein n=1 Tax=Salvator merianae TaxID=96440 RepID=A0A8D0DMB6_SALMN